jgi:hypothetical protein
MKLEILLTPTEEAHLSAEAERAGLAPEERVRRIALERLPDTLPTPEGELDARLRQWQEQDRTELSPDESVRNLFVQWDEEDAGMSEAEREAEGRLWEGIERALTEQGGVVALKRAYE